MSDGFYALMVVLTIILAFFLGIDSGVDTDQAIGCSSACERRGGEDLKTEMPNICACTTGHVLKLDLGAMWVERGRE